MKYEKTRIMQVNVDDHDYAADTRAAKILQKLIEPIIMALLKLTPRTAIIANVTIRGDMRDGVVASGGTVLMKNTTILHVPGRGVYVNDSNRNPESPHRIHAAGNTHQVPETGGQEMKWQPIETAPKDGSEILAVSTIDMAVVFWKNDHWDFGYDCTDGFGGDEINDLIYHNPTHWMPLPEPPETDQ